MDDSTRLNGAGRSTPVRPVEWQRALRDADLPTLQWKVLMMLSMRMSADGTGFASQAQLADDARCSRWTVHRALTWARERGYLVRTRRGHRITDDTAIASEYRLASPASQRHDPAGSVRESAPAPDPTLQPGDPTLQPSAHPEVFSPEVCLKASSEKDLRSTRRCATRAPSKRAPKRTTISSEAHKIASDYVEGLDDTVWDRIDAMEPVEVDAGYVTLARCVQDRLDGGESPGDADYVVGQSGYWWHGIGRADNVWATLAWRIRNAREVPVDRDAVEARYMAHRWHGLDTGEEPDWRQAA